MFWDLHRLTAVPGRYGIDLQILHAKLGTALIFTVYSMMTVPEAICQVRESLARARR